jgi:hypothetical protein
LDNKWPISFGPISDPLAFGGLYLAKYFEGLIYFISHIIKNQLKNTATLHLTAMWAGAVQSRTEMNCSSQWSRPLAVKPLAPLMTKSSSP